MNDGPLAFFITWTVYGTHLPGDIRGWRKYGKGFRAPRPKLAAWCEKHLKHSVELLSVDERVQVKNAIDEICNHRQWKLWASNPRTNHNHAVVSAHGYSGDTVRDQLKAKCTLELRRLSPKFKGRAVWTRGGFWDCVDTEDELEACINYVNEAQDRKDRDLD